MVHEGLKPLAERVFATEGVEIEIRVLSQPEC